MCFDMSGGDEQGEGEELVACFAQLGEFLGGSSGDKKEGKGMHATTFGQVASQRSFAEVAYNWQQHVAFFGGMLGIVGKVGSESGIGVSKGIDMLVSTFGGGTIGKVGSQSGIGVSKGFDMFVSTFGEGTIGKDARMRRRRQGMQTTIRTSRRRAVFGFAVSMYGVGFSDLFPD